MQPRHRSHPACTSARCTHATLLEHSEELPPERPSRLAGAVPLNSERVCSSVLKKLQQRALALQRLERVPTFKGRLSPCPLVDSSVRCATAAHKSPSTRVECSAQRALSCDAAERKAGFPSALVFSSAADHALCTALGLVDDLCCCGSKSSARSVAHARCSLTLPRAQGPRRSRRASPARRVAGAPLAQSPPKWQACARAAP